jgi:hypothetical protein
LFHEYFDGENGRGLGASHQTGWTALVVRCLETVATSRRADAAFLSMSSPGLAGLHGHPIVRDTASLQA